MRLFFLGTAAAEGYPGVFCDCENCREARKLGGRNLRFRSALMVNEDLLIDFGPDLSAAAQKFSLTFEKVTTGLVTHAHMDHFFMGNFEMRGSSFTGRLDIPMLTLYGPHDVQDELAKAQPDLAEWRMESRTVHAFDCWKHNGYAFTAYHAYHAVGSLEALFYSVDDGQHAFLYATDTGAFPEDTWQALKGKTFDAIILEETLGVGQYSQHQSIESFLVHEQRMRAEGMLRPGGRFIAQHFSHTSNPTYDKLRAIFNPHDVEVAYDGLEVNL